MSYNNPSYVQANYPTLWNAYQNYGSNLSQWSGFQNGNYTTYMPWSGAVNSVTGNYFTDMLSNYSNAYLMQN